MHHPDLAIIVTSYQMPWHLRRVLESIAVQKTSRKLEVVVTDDGSTDNTAQVVAAFAAAAPFPVHFVTHPHNGFHAARCRNNGVRGSSAAHLLFVDGDCLLPPDHIDQHLRATRPGIVTTSYCVRLEQQPSEGVTIDAVRRGEFLELASTDARRQLRHMHFKSIWYTLIGHPTKPSFRSGNFSLAREAYERINGFDENFQGWGCEDDDFGRRLRLAGLQMLSILNRTCVYHLWHPPAPSRPERWKQGANVNYLHRPVRLMRCVRGLSTRSAGDLSVRVMVDGPWPLPVQALLANHGWTLEASRRAHTDLEIVCLPGRGRFSVRTDCRMLLVLDETLSPRATAAQAHIVLSKSGRFGLPEQIRLPVDDVAALWSVLEGRSALIPQRSAA